VDSIPVGWKGRMAEPCAFSRGLSLQTTHFGVLIRQGTVAMDVSENSSCRPVIRRITGDKYGIVNILFLNSSAPTLFE
jgi:hypothetical protein